MENSDKKIITVINIMEFLVRYPYDVEVFSKYAYTKGLDDQVYSYEDKELYEIFDLLGGMSAGEEFHYTKAEVFEMLTSYLSRISFS